MRLRANFLPRGNISNFEGYVGKIKLTYSKTYLQNMWEW